MHYYIDGYNLLFRLMHNAHDDLQTHREAIILDINKKAALLKLDISIVFDSTFQIGDRTRSHYDALEILYTAHGETADDYIIDELKQSTQPQKETVVTSDKKLAWRARTLSAHTESINDFLLWINKSYKNKQQRLRKGNLPAKSPRIAPLPQEEPKLAKPLIPPKNAPLEAYSDYYAQIFEAEWQEMVKNQQISKEEVAAQQAAQKTRPPRHPRQKKDPFKPPPIPEPDTATELERWLKLFEKELPQG